MRYNLTLSLVACAITLAGSCSSEPTSEPLLPGFEALQNTAKPWPEPAAATTTATAKKPVVVAPLNDGQLSINQIISECDRQIYSWNIAMSQSRSEDNQQVVSIAANAIGLFVTRYREQIENEAISGEDRFRGIASAALGFSGDESVLPILLNNLSSDNSTVCAKSLLGLGILSSSNTAIAPIADAIAQHSDDEEVISNAAFCLFQISFTDSQDTNGAMSSVLLSIINHSSATVRSQSILSLGLIGANHCLGEITDALAGDQSPDVRVAAAWSLGRIGSKNSTRALVAALSDPDTIAAGTARASLARIHGRDLGPDPESWIPED
ncbi:MAG: HEAT repeat domain-containing protein [Planctomycetes bacterium]|nr:HEAT repeat domain-containing protein [Planctomycetota bacterium]